MVSLPFLINFDVMVVVGTLPSGQTVKLVVDLKLVNFLNRAVSSMTG